MENFVIIFGIIVIIGVIVAGIVLNFETPFASEDRKIAFGILRNMDSKTISNIRSDGDYYIIQSSVLIDDLLDTLNLSWHDIGLEETDYSGETVGYVITSELERFPEKNEKLIFEAEQTDKKHHTDEYQHKALHIEIAKRDDNTIQEIIAKVIITP